MEIKNKCHYYAAHSYMGLNYTYDSPCWVIYAFDTKSDRDNWVNNHTYNDNGNLVAESVSADVARKIAPDLRKWSPDDKDTYYTKQPHRVIHL
jgi:hypothetical protein